MVPSPLQPHQYSFVEWPRRIEIAIPIHVDCDWRTTARNWPVGEMHGTLRYPRNCSAFCSEYLFAQQLLAAAAAVPTQGKLDFCLNVICIPSSMCARVSCSVRCGQRLNCSGWMTISWVSLSHLSSLDMCIVHCVFVCVFVRLLIMERIANTLSHLVSAPVQSSQVYVQAISSCVCVCVHACFANTSICMYNL